MKRFTVTKDNYFLLDHEKEIGYEPTQQGVNDICNLLNNLHEQNTLQAETIAKLREALKKIYNGNAMAGKKNFTHADVIQEYYLIARAILAETEQK